MDNGREEYNEFSVRGDLNGQWERRIEWIQSILLFVPSQFLVINQCFVNSVPAVKLRFTDYVKLRVSSQNEF